MAVYVLMEKMEDNAEKVVYRFGPNHEHMGIIEFNKIEKEFSVLKSVDDGVVSNKAYEQWAVEKIAKIMYRENSVFPDKTAVEK